MEVQSRRTFLGPPKPVLERGGEQQLPGALPGSGGLPFDVGRALAAQRAGLENAKPEGGLVRHGFKGKASLG